MSTQTQYADLLTGEQWVTISQRTRRSAGVPVSSRIYQVPNDPRFWLVITWPGSVGDGKYVGTLSEMRQVRHSLGG